MIFLKSLVRLFGGIYNFKNKLNKSNNMIVKKIMIKSYNRYLGYNGSYIGHTAQIDGELITPHGLLGVFISGDAIIGQNCVIFQQVTIGSNTLVDSSRKGSPIIGSNCYIGAGAKIIGGIKIGNNVRIGANAVIVKDIPDNSLVVLQEARIIEKKGMDNKFYSQNDGKWGYYYGQQWNEEINETILKNLCR